MERNTKQPVMTTQAKKKSSSKKRRERRVRAKSKLNVASGPNQAVYPLPTYSNTGMKLLSKIPRKNLTPGGEAFLKCAFAPPDFAASSPTGVPDQFRGVSLLKKHRYVGNLVCNTPNTDHYLVLIPTAGGTAFWKTTVPAGTPIVASTLLEPVYFSDTSAIFNGADAMADVVNKYRFVSNHIELIPTMNQMSWSGSIQAWKAPINMIVRQGGAADNLYTVTGLQAMNSSNSNQYTGPTNLGLYTAAYNTSVDFEFKDIVEGVPGLPRTPTDSDFGKLDGALGGIDPQFESVIVKISGMGANPLNTFVVKVWCCVEYQVVPGSSLYEYQTISPSDDYAMQLYRAIILQLPVGVSFLENEGFWKRVLAIIKGISGAMSILPGPYGVISGGVNSVASGIESLVL